MRGFTKHRRQPQQRNPAMSNIAMENDLITF